VHGNFPAVSDFQPAGNNSRSQNIREFSVILEICDTQSHQKIAVEIISAGGRKSIRLGDKEICFDWARLEDGHYSLILDNKVLDLTIDLDTEKCTVAGLSETYSFRITDSRYTGVRSQAEAGPAGLLRVCAEMPGKVVRVLVKEGETVSCDQSLLVLEAMKMQNEIRAPKAGRVKEIAAVGGTAVNTGDFLLSIES